MTSQLTKTDVERLTQLYLDIFNSHDLNRYSEILAENYVNHTRMGTVEGLEDFKQFRMGLYSAFPDIQWFGDDTVAEDCIAQIEMRESAAIKQSFK